MTIVAFKAVHIAALLLWCAGLLALPLVLERHHSDEGQGRYARLRRFTHYGYIAVVTPAAVLAIAAGTALVWMRDAFVPWMFVKLLAVGALVAIHVYVGHTVLLMSERRGAHTPAPMWPVALAAGIVMLVILLLVLGKPALPDNAPDWLRTPRYRPLPFDATPN